MDANKEKEDATSTAKSDIAQDLSVPLRVLISPFRAFRQLAQQPSARGLLTIVVLMLSISAVAQYAFGTKIFLTINGESVGFVTTDLFMNWFVGALANIVAYSIILYWLVAAISMALIGRFFGGGKAISLRVSLTVLGYLLSVFVVLWTVRAIIYLSLPPIAFPYNTWPPIEPSEREGATSLIVQSWGPLLGVRFDFYFAYATFVWLVLLGMVAVKTMYETTWVKAGIVAVLGFMFAFMFFLGPP